MRVQTIAVWALAAAMAVAVVPGMAQQEEGPILRPKKPIAKPASPTAKPASPTLLVICDLACNWTLDGAAQGRIEAGGSAKAKVELGQHVVAAATEDGLDKDEKELGIKAGGQTIVHIALRPFRDERLKAEQEAKDKAARQQQEQATEQQERERIARENASELTWTDPVTKLMWTKADNGNEVSWTQAVGYCQSMRLEGHADWRAPTITELNGISSTGASVACYNGKLKCHIKGNIRLSTGRLWGRKTADMAGQIHDFASDEKIWSEMKKYEKKLDRTLCVRRSGN
jgi:hypothetical protein